MTLTCGPSEVNIGEISGSVWKFNGREMKNSARINIVSSGSASTVQVRDVILADRGK